MRRFGVGTVGWLFGFVLIGASSAKAQELPIEFDGLILGMSTKADVERTYQIPLICAKPKDAPDPNLMRLEFCTSNDSNRKPEAIFLDGRLRNLRVLLPKGSDVRAVVASFTERYGPPRKLETGSGETRGLRYWEFGAGDFLLVLSETKNIATGELRLRVMVTDQSGGWTEWGQRRPRLQNQEPKG